VKTQRRIIVQDGILQSYFLATYSARKLGMKTTGNAGGNHNLILRPGELDFNGLLKKWTWPAGHRTARAGCKSHHRRLFARRGGFWVENGEIQYPVEEITIASNLKDMYTHIAAVGNDVLVQGSRQCGSILVENMMVAGQ